MKPILHSVLLAAQIAALTSTVACRPPAEDEAPPPSPEPDLALPAAVATVPFVPACKMSAPPAPSDPDNFTFVVFGDSQNKNHTGYPVLRNILADMAALNPAFAISLGDVIVGEDPSKEDEFAGELDTWCQLVKTESTVPIFDAPGNHELVLWNQDGGENPVKKLRNQYVDLVGPLRGHFDYGNSRFIVLDTDEIMPGEGLGGKGEHSYVSETQRGEIEQAIAQAPGTHAFLFSHYPLEAADPEVELASSSAEPIREYLAGEVAKKVIAFAVGSHDHRFWQPDSSATTIPPHTAGEGPRYLVTGGAGAPLDTGAQYNYLSFRVSGSTVDVTYHEVEGPTSD